MHGDQLMEDGADAFSTSDEEEEESEDDSEEIQPQKRMKRMIYDDRQQMLRSQFLEAADEGDLGPDTAGTFGGLERVDDCRDDSEDETRAQELLDELFDRSNKMTNDDHFLRDFFAKKQWIETGEEDLDDLDTGPDPNEDEHFLEEAEKFENAYNFRFEVCSIVENGVEEIQSLSEYALNIIRAQLFV